MVVWHSSNKVNQHRVRLVLAWVTKSGFNSRCGTFILVCNQPPRSTPPGHPFVVRHNEYQPKGGESLRLGPVKAGMVWFVCGWQVKLCDSIATYGPSVCFRDKELIINRYINSSVYLLHSLFSYDNSTGNVWHPALVSQCPTQSDITAQSCCQSLWSTTSLYLIL